MYKVNGELSSCDITYSGRVSSREGDTHNFAFVITFLKRIIQICSNFYCCGFVKLLSTHPIRIVVWGNIPFKLLFWGATCTFHIPLNSATLNRLLHYTLWQFSGARIFIFEGSFFAFGCQIAKSPREIFSLAMALLHVFQKMTKKHTIFCTNLQWTNRLPTQPYADS